MSLKQAFLNDGQIELEHAVSRLHKSGRFNNGEIALLLDVDITKVNNLIRKIKNKTVNTG